MIADVIEVGNKIDIMEINNSKKSDLVENRPIREGKVVYKSQVFDILDNDELKILMPFDGPKVVVLPLNGSYNMCFYTRTGLFQCVGNVIDRYKTSNQLVLVVALKTGLQKVQRREFFRLQKILDIDYRMLTEQESQMESVEEILKFEQNQDSEMNYFQGIVVDLGGGGARFISTQQYDISTYIIIKLKITVNSEQKRLRVIGRIINSEKLQNKSGQYETRVEFVRIKNQDREKLIQYIFEEERKMRQKEKS